ncbi:hypothetical protein CLIB1444_06S05226 [[Candida] jaroonii]|uniref:Uncharacterized protein n=1 Tax=[Candida] jaroonii TaxID=467808 RepID=A0ACA9Y9S8_9ASCO|nr:hypothetical protein CLIB1444_06S05226 [[Candida] jaroonii]
MSLSETYLLASKVRSKLTKDAANAKISLRNLVTQANMLDNLMDHIQIENEKRLTNLNKVKFDLSSKKPERSNLSYVTQVNEYEIDEESESDEDDDYYYSSEEEDSDYDADEEIEMPSFKLSTIEEVDDENLPELTISSDEDSDEEILITPNHSLFKNTNKKLSHPIIPITEIYN